MKVLRVNTVSVPANASATCAARRAGPRVQRADWKKAIVTLREGDKIELGGVNYFES